MSELKHHPWTTLSAMIALAGVIVMFPRYLQANEITQRVANIEVTQARQIKETLENRLGSLRSSLFDIQARIDEIRGRGEHVDDIYFAEYKRLSNEIDEVTRQLGSMR